MKHTLSIKRGYPMTRQHSGFTLIELLVVVAIIAILAAIAIPNFLAAQIRAKVSRVNADVRTLATAVESYYVDYNDYPSSTVVESQGSEIRGSAYSFIPNVITTPISYVSNNKIDDVFAVGIYDDQHNRIFWQNCMWLYLNYHSRGWEDPLFSSTYYPTYGEWKMGSIGPNASYDYYHTYDPTNGTVSNGDIYRTQRNPGDTVIAL